MCSKKKNRLRKTNDGGGGVDVAPPPLWGSLTSSTTGCSQNIPQYDKQKPQQNSLFSGQIRKLDRLGRSLTQVALILEEMNNHGVALIVTSQGIDTSNTNPAVKLQLNVLMAVAEFERGIIRERVNAGLKAAKLRGVRLGRPRSLHKKTGAVLGEKKNALGVRAIARKLQMPPSSAHKILKSADVN